MEGRHAGESRAAVRYLSAAASGETDAELLGRFIDRRDESAFALLVRRHGAMVYGVCRRILPTDQDAEDAFQATFLVLAKKASTAPREVANWLYGVARRAALLSRRSISRRRERVGEVPERPANRADELRSLLDEELSRLPDTYRAVLVLCDLEGRTRREAAALLGWPEGTVAGRLVRARELLAKRLAPAILIAALPVGQASARVPEILPLTAAIPPAVAALTREVLGAMLRGKLVKAATVVLLLCSAGFGMVLQAGPDKAAPKETPALSGSTEAPVNPPKADDVVWGKEVGGLQAGLVATTPTCRVGESIKLKVKLRNVGKADVKFTYVLLREHPPTVTDAAGVRMTVAMPPSPRYYVPVTERVIKPGETIDLYAPILEVQSADLPTLDGLLLVDTPTVYAPPGKYKVSFGGMLTSHPKLTTGTVKIEVKDTPPADPPAKLVAKHRHTVVANKAEPVFIATRCAFLDNDRVLVQSGNALEVLDAKSGKALKSVSLDKQFLGDFRLSADRKWVAAVTTPDTTGTFTIPDPGVTVWDTTTWKVRGTIDDRVLLGLASDGRTVLVGQYLRPVGEGDKVELWDVVEKKKLKVAPFEFNRIDAAALSPDGSVVVVSGLNEIAYWKWRDGDNYDRLKVGRKVDALVFSPDGKFVAEGPDSRTTVEVREVATLKVAHELSDPAQPRVPFSVAGMVFADSGKTLVFGNGVGLIESIPVPHRVHFWDVKSGKPILKIDLKGGAPSSLDVSPDGKTLAALTADGGVSLRVFDLSSER